MKLNLGSGNEYLEGYTNIDDCSMFPDSRVDQKADIKTLEWHELVEEIKLSHVVMYFRPEELQPLFKRWHSWLQTNGKLYIETIDVKKVAKIVTSSQPQSVIDSWGLTNLFGTVVTGPHKWGWSKQALMVELYRAGFSHVKVVKGLKKPDRDFLIIGTK